MKYKVGDKVRIKSWSQMESEFRKNDNGHLITDTGRLFRSDDMKHLCGTIQEIIGINKEFKSYSIDCTNHFIDDSMISSLVTFPPETEFTEPKSDEITFKPAEKDNYEIHKELCLLLNDVYVSKNHDYGNTFGKGFAEYGMIMPVIRLEDKFNRFKKLAMSGEQQVKDESIEDTLLDLANYALMTVTEMRMKNE